MASRREVSALNMLLPNDATIGLRLCDGHTYQRKQLRTWLYYVMSCHVMSCHVMLCYILLYHVMLWAIRADFLYVFRKSSRLHERKLWFLYILFRLTERFYEVSLSTFGPMVFLKNFEAV